MVTRPVQPGQGLKSSQPRLTHLRQAIRTWTNEGPDVEKWGPTPSRHLAVRPCSFPGQGVPYTHLSGPGKVAHAGLSPSCFGSEVGEAKTVTVLCRIYPMLLLIPRN